MALKRLTLTRGDTHKYSLLLKKKDGTPYCLKNWVLYFTLKTNPELGDSDASLQKIVTQFQDTTSGGTSGLAEVQINPADTENLTPGEYDFDFAVTTAANENLTILKGKLDLEYDVTRSKGTAGTA